MLKDHIYAIECGPLAGHIDNHDDEDARFGFETCPHPDCVLAFAPLAGPVKRYRLTHSEEDGSCEAGITPDPEGALVRYDELAGPVDGESRCNNCGWPHPFDTSVSSAVWNDVIRRAGLPEYLCTTCIITAFVQANTSFCATLWGDQFSGAVAPAIEVRVNSQPPRDAEMVSEENNTLRIRVRELEDAAAAAGPVDASPERVKALARSFAAEWLRPSDPEHATPAVVDTLQTAMLAFFAVARRFGPVDASGEPIRCKVCGEYLPGNCSSAADICECPEPGIRQHTCQSSPAKPCASCVWEAKEAARLKAAHERLEASRATSRPVDASGEPAALDVAAIRSALTTTARGFQYRRHVAGGSYRTAKDDLAEAVAEIEHLRAAAAAAVPSSPVADSPSKESK